ncbi:MAG: DUF6111 family protein [Sneathiellaceae bacterium]
MLRQILYHVLPMAVPFAMYAAYLWLQHRRGAAQAWRDAPLTWLFVAGFVLVIASFVVLRFESNEAKDLDYRPPAYVDGEIVPAGKQPVPARPEPDRTGPPQPDD